MLNIKDGYKLELPTPETMKIFGSIKKSIDRTKNLEHIHNLEVAEVDLVQFNLADNQYQQIFEVLYTFMSNKSYPFQLNGEPSNLVFLKTFNTK